MLDPRLGNQVLGFAWLNMNFNGILCRTLTPMKRSLGHSMSKFGPKALGRVEARRVICAGLASAIFLHGAVIPAHSDTNLLPGAPQLYTVQPGDSLWSIALDFSVNPGGGQTYCREIRRSVIPSSFSQAICWFLVRETPVSS